MVTDRQPPYPADTRAKGWRFELDYEKIDQSDTWSLASEIPLARACLLAMWLGAWTQDPCGSLPNDEAVIRARCQIPAQVWAKVRSVLMRGWWLASDGRLYHDTLAKRVLEMVEYRRKTAKRVADFKAAQREQHDANALPTREQSVKNDTGTGTGTNTSSPTVTKGRKRQPAPDGVDEGVWVDFLSLRKAKRAPVTETVIQGAQAEALKAGMSLEAFLRVWCRRGTQGLEADWLKPHERAAAPAETSFTRDRKAQAAAWMGSAAPRNASAEIIDMEEENGPRLAVG